MTHYGKNIPIKQNKQNKKRKEIKGIMKGENGKLKYCPQLHRRMHTPFQADVHVMRQNNRAIESMAEEDQPTAPCTIFWSQGLSEGIRVCLRG